MNKIRVITLALIIDKEKILVSKGYDLSKNLVFYRALGGEVEFGETSQEALRREFREEIQAEITNINYLGCIENLFNFEDKPRHEIIQLYQCDFADSKIYQITPNTHRALWIDITRFKSGSLKLVPEAFFNYLS